jgi:hypothetical protein
VKNGEETSKQRGLGYSQPVDKCLCVGKTIERARNGRETSSSILKRACATGDENEEKGGNEKGDDKEDLGQDEDNDFGQKTGAARHSSEAFGGSHHGRQVRALEGRCGLTVIGKQQDDNGAQVELW